MSEHSIIAEVMKVNVSHRYRVQLIDSWRIRKPVNGVIQPVGKPIPMRLYLMETGNAPYGKGKLMEGLRNWDEMVDSTIEHISVVLVELVSIINVPIIAVMVKQV